MINIGDKYYYMNEEAATVYKVQYIAKNKALLVSPDDTEECENRIVWVYDLARWPWERVDLIKEETVEQEKLNQTISMLNGEIEMLERMRDNIENEDEPEENKLYYYDKFEREIMELNVLYVGADGKRAWVEPKDGNGIGDDLYIFLDEKFATTKRKVLNMEIADRLSQLIDV